MSELSSLFRSTHRYFVDYTAYAGRHEEFEIQGENCRVVSDCQLTNQEIAEELAQHIREQDDIPVSRVILHRVAQSAR